MLLLRFGEPEVRGSLARQAGHRVRVGTAPNRLEIGEVSERLAHGSALVVGSLIDRRARVTRQDLGEGDRVVTW